jgi:hypothetical protein
MGDIVNFKGFVARKADALRTSMNQKLEQAYEMINQAVESKHDFSKMVKVTKIMASAADDHAELKRLESMLQNREEQVKA